MQIDEALLTKLEKLSYIKIASEEKDEMIKNLSEILNFVDNLQELDTSKSEQTFTMSENATYLREDIAICDTNINESILSNAPRADEHFFIVPKIID